jgi:hypothetical protein
MDQKVGACLASTRPNSNPKNFLKEKKRKKLKEKRGE